MLKIRKEVKFMPSGDGTGPWGEGSMTGRRAGFCAGFEAPGFINSFRRGGFGRGGRFGRGRGRGFGRRIVERYYPRPYYPTRPIRKEDELTFLKDEVSILKEDKKSLENELESIKKRIEELQKQ